MSSPAQPTAPRRDGLDVMRALAILAVLAFHAPAVVHDALPLGLRAAFAHGWMGVDLFFVLSGYLVGRQVFSRHAEQGGVAELRTFWLKRWGRTLPLYYVVLALYALKPWTFGTPFLGGGWHYALFLQNFTGLSDFVQSWSLCVEEHFYLVLPLLAFGLRGRRWPAWVWCLPIAVSFTARWLTWRELPQGLPLPQLPALLSWPTLHHLDGLAVGVFLAKTAPVWQRWAASWRAACGVLGAVVLAVTVGVCGPLLAGVGALWVFTGLSVGFGLLLVGTESIQLPAGPRWGIYQVAVLSYGAYLWHGFVVRGLERTHLSLGAWPLDLLVYLGATLAVAWVTYVAVEQPGLRWRDWLLARFEARARAERLSPVPAGEGRQP
ncbi:acyltransferase family protein [Pyxidicoccus caerfyrddinensis]|uniref:acyltransferase family protein n=1 Tax=Pyxidicoccus caerfyrddinensis TaxID=2709663 RepID=UPI0013DA1D58|nr:acyltransferase [Pyxidicoccus caerfyrddinensis]